MLSESDLLYLKGYANGYVKSHKVNVERFVDDEFDEGFRDGEADRAEDAPPLVDFGADRILSMHPIGTIISQIDGDGRTYSIYAVGNFPGYPRNISARVNYANSDRSWFALND